MGAWAEADIILVSSDCDWWGHVTKVKNLIFDLWRDAAASGLMLFNKAVSGGSYGLWHLRFHKLQRLTCVFAELCPRCSSNQGVSWTKRAVCDTISPTTRGGRPPQSNLAVIYGIRILSGIPEWGAAVTTVSLAPSRLAFSSGVWHTARFDKLRNQAGKHKGQRLTVRRHIVPPRRCCEEWGAWYRFQPHQGGRCISIQGQESGFGRRLNRLGLLRLSERA